MTADWIHYFDQPTYRIVNAFEGQDDERLIGQVKSLHGKSSIDWGKVRIALIGINDARNSVHKGCAEAADQMRPYLMGLRSLSKPFGIVDLGNVRGNTINDRYKALEEVIVKLLELKIIPVIIGGSQDYTVPMCRAIQQYTSEYNLAVVDSKIDWLAPEQDFSASSFIGYVCSHMCPKDMTVVGAQKYLYSAYQEEQVRNQSFEIIRLGQIRQIGHQLVEPVMRDAHVLSVDMTSVRQCDQPAHLVPMPNGLTGEELCQFMWYAGQSDKLLVYGLFEQDTVLDSGHQGVVLGAQAIWHILEGIALRYNDYPVNDLEKYRQFIVYLEDYELEIKFYNNPENDRWWVEIPGANNTVEVIACGRKDFDVASANEIPEKWFRYIQKKSL